MIKNLKISTQISVCLITVVTFLVLFGLSDPAMK